ncbi:ergothioneine biosynthesis glutamate--cysteine ligase EgtA [Natronosporangium hydrolyticum]|uniref:Glutamate--cysteine ligase EgtA n=1 Tax=Natronosporangium hydrolyticum TaxID=2811111 RepID=A0A895YNI2_9ACTN|nr:ergothioneine biosynthesis glutamate--cysteine ligase EgtA [Natronosporangium hydrolyticum]QSB15680.1 ergothioneine biosynthesis glutamate--cysteine ligase EgtA [Natronosporangium hydrolyticum]
MATLSDHARVATESRVLRTMEDALEHVHAICFKTGPPRRVGVELEWLLHRLDDPASPLDLTRLRHALGPHAPPALDPDSPHEPLPHGGTVTLEPGGQLEISTPPAVSLSELHRTTEADLAYLTSLLDRAGLGLGDTGIDPHRPPRRLLHTPRYDAMAAAFALHGSAGLTMMCATAATQVCLDAGEAAATPSGGGSESLSQVSQRWRAVHQLGPVLVALFANSARHAGRDTGWASARMRTWLATDPTRTAPVPVGPDPATAWGRYAVAAPLLCLRRPGGGWSAPAGVTFADWLAGALAPAPTVEDLEYHLGTLFPPVRPRGYLELRFLDAQPPGEWFVPVAVVAALLADPDRGAAAAERAAPVASAWQEAARFGLAHPGIRAAAAAVAELAMAALDRLELTAPVREQVTVTVGRRLAGGKGATR